MSSTTRNPFDFNVSLVIRERNGFLYLIPYSDMLMKNTLLFLKRDPFLRDYHYQNQTDRDPGITDKDWREREETWDHFDARWRDMLILDICSNGSLQECDPFFSPGWRRRAGERVAKKLKESENAKK